MPHHQVIPAQLLLETVLSLWCGASGQLCHSTPGGGLEKEMEYKEQNSHLDEASLERGNKRERERESATERDQKEVFARFCKQMTLGIYGG